MKCFYHEADLDGHCSGAIVKHAFPECEMIGYDYGKRFPWAAITPGEDVVMVDVSLPASEMGQLSALCLLTWIDHHKTAIEDAARAGLIIPGVRTVGLAACELAWGYFMPNLPVPRAVRLLGRYDVWDHGDAEVLPFQFGAKVLDLDPRGGADRGLWQELFKDHRPDVERIVENGQLILKYKRHGDAKKADNAFETRLGGLRVIAMNGHGNSESFRSVYARERHAAMVMFHMRRDGQWRVSVYSDNEDVDCGAICKARGGGGHKGAAGFITTEMPREFLVREPEVPA